MCSTRTRKEARRRKSLGELGELIAVKVLVDDSFDRIANLNDSAVNYPFADLIAEKGGKRLVISVKARNKFQRDGSLNASYKLGSNAYAHAVAAEVEFAATACWMAIQFDEKTFSVYMGELQELGHKKAIPLRRCEDGRIGRCLAKDLRHYFDFGYFGNTKQTRRR